MEKEGNHLDYVQILKALDDIPFRLGKNLLIDFLRGDESNDSIERNRLYEKKSFGTMAYSQEELSDMIENLVRNGLVQVSGSKENKFWKLLSLTEKGRKEIISPELYKRKLSFSFKTSHNEVSESDRNIFDNFKDFLEKYNDEQKKTIISPKKHILCLAGAGSGKTSVLAKRIEFLARYRSVAPEKVLAITFTRKARQDMMNRISKVHGLEKVSIETFNSFCEKVLKQHNDMIYGKQVRVVSYREKILMMNSALAKLNMNMQNAIDIYFTMGQRAGKGPEQLAAIFMNDCFFIRDYFKFKNKRLEESSFDIPDKEHERSAKMVFAVCSFIEGYMANHGLRDFADQLIDTLDFFEKHKGYIPKFEHILIDEYQDVNSTQMRLVKLLNPENIFCVGDPRQSIYGWRGSDIRYILNFEEKYPDCEIITLKKNYRSTSHIVKLINTSIKSMGLADLESSKDGEKDVKLLRFESEDAEFEFIMQKILASEVPRGSIFVLARTNRQLNDISNIMKIRNISHIVRSDEQKSTVIAGEHDVTLATVHAIKGLEAEMVIVVGCNGMNFPCKASEHPIIDMVKVDEYDKDEEERRLFYVAMSRAKSSLYLTYSGKKPTSFITNSMMPFLDEKVMKLAPKEDIRYKKNLASDPKSIVERLKDWRRKQSTMQNVPPYIIMHDRTLIEIAQKEPQSLQDLEKVYGLGPIRIMKYGDEILDLIR